MDTTQTVATLLIILLNSIGAIISARYTKLPLTLCILLWGILSSAIIPMTGFDTGIRAHNFQALILFVLIPVLVFEAALNLHTHILRPILSTVLFSATVGIVLASSIAAAILYFAIDHPGGFPWIAALIAGLVISATDPVAVVSQLKDAKAPDKLATLIEGESLFNDATAIVLFGILLSMALGQEQSSAGGALILLAKVLLGGILVGFCLGWLCKALLPLLGASSAHYIVASLALAYGSFYVAEHMLHVSGVIAVLTAALVAKEALLKCKLCEAEVHNSWELLAFLANILVFYLMGLVVTFEMFSDQWLAMLFGIIAAFISRLVSSYFSLFIGRFVFRDPLPISYAPVMIWGGLRGVITIALVLSLPVELEYWWTIQSIGFGVVLFTLVVQATTNPWLVRKLKLPG
jgi:CPA1 family monovalent cation:H+ antiporter